MEVIQVPIRLLYLKTVSDWSSCHAIETEEEPTINSSRKSCGGEAKHFVESISWTQLNGHLGQSHRSAGSGGCGGEREGRSPKDPQRFIYSHTLGLPRHFSGLQDEAIKSEDC